MQKKNFADSPSRLSCIFLTDSLKKAKDYVGAQKGRLNTDDSQIVSKVCVVKLNGKLLKTNNIFNQRDGRSIDEFEFQATKYFNGVDENYNHEFNEYIFEGVAQIIDIII